MAWVNKDAAISPQDTLKGFEPTSYYGCVKWAPFESDLARIRDNDSI